MVLTNLITNYDGRGFFDTKEHTFRRLNIGSLPLRSTPQPDDMKLNSLDGLEEEVIGKLKALQDVGMAPRKTTEASEILPHAMETNLTDTTRMHTLSGNTTQAP